MQSNGNNSTKLWYIPVFSFLMPLASPFGLLYIGSVTKKDSWLAIFFVTLIINILSLVFLTSEKSLVAGIGGLAFFVNWAFILLFMVTTKKQVLQASSGATKTAPVGTGKKETVRETAQTESWILGEQLINNLYKWQHEIESLQMKNDIGEIVNLCSIVMKRDDQESLRFFKRYGDRVNSMLERYDQIENTRLNTPEMIKTMELIEKSVSDIVVAFKNEINEMYKKDLLDLNADTTVFVQELKNKGLIE